MCNHIDTDGKKELDESEKQIDDITLTKDQRSKMMRNKKENSKISYISRRKFRGGSLEEKAK